MGKHKKPIPNELLQSAFKRCAKAAQSASKISKIYDALEVLRAIQKQTHRHWFNKLGKDAGFQDKDEFKNVLKTKGLQNGMVNRVREAMPATIEKIKAYADENGITLRDSTPPWRREQSVRPEEGRVALNLRHTARGHQRQLRV